MSSEPSNDRDQLFKDMLLALSKKLGERDVEQMEYETSTEANGAAGNCKPLQLLTALRNKGIFSPVKCHPPEDLLKKIDRHDLADYVKNKYLDTYPDQGHHWASFPEKGSTPNLEKERSSTGPPDMPQSTLSLPLTESTDAQHEQMGRLENGPVPPTSLPNKEKNAVSLESFPQAFSSPDTSPSINSWRYRQHMGFENVSFPPSHTRTGSGSSSQRYTSQSSQDPYSSSSSISRVSSSSSLPQSLHEAVISTTAHLLLDQMTGDSEMHREVASCCKSMSMLSVASSDSRRYYKHSRSYHGPHSGDPDARMPKKHSHSFCLHNASNGRMVDDLTTHAQPTASAMNTIQGPTINEILSDPEHAEEERGRVDSRTEHSQRRAERVTMATNPYSNGELIPNEQEASGASYDDTTLRPQRQRRNRLNREHSLTPKVSMEQPSAESRSFDGTLRECQPSTLLGNEHCDHPAGTPSPPRAAKPSSKEKIWRKSFPSTARAN